MLARFSHGVAATTSEPRGEAASSEIVKPAKIMDGRRIMAHLQFLDISALPE